MKDFHWVWNRLRSMNVREVIWRLQQKKLQKREYRTFFVLNCPVTDIPLSDEINRLTPDINGLPINPDNRCFSLFETLDLFDIFDYEEFKKKWNAGFQTKNIWPVNDFSYNIDIGQREDIGDIRTNWELNRHFQFVGLAKNYYVTSNDKYLLELQDLFSDWNNSNLFLHGVQWTSAMEVAIRMISWAYMYVFLKQSRKVDDNFLQAISHGIKVMAEYVLKHRARYSSANNHLIIEMTGIGIAGFLFRYDKWIDASIKVLTEELPRQNYSDGVNREMSLHYQSFVMEAYGLMWLCMYKNKRNIPESWKQYLTAMSEFIADSTDDYGSTMEFGDNDEGKVLDFAGKIANHYQYVLNLMGCLLDKKYSNSEWHENLYWIVPDDLRQPKELYVPDFVCSRKKGGYTFLRSKDRKVLIGIDHADLGFGSIAAHGHADALSFQMFVEGHPVFVDSGTYNYHVPACDRNYYRSTAAHNTVMVEGKEQSEMLGPFMWGKRATTSICKINDNDNNITIIATCKNGKTEHRRSFYFNYSDIFVIEDWLSERDGIEYLNFLSDSNIGRKNKELWFTLGNREVHISFSSADLFMEKRLYSEKYNNVIESKTLKLSFSGTIKTEIQWKDIL